MKMGNWPQSRHAGVADLRARPTSSLLVDVSGARPLSALPKQLKNSPSPRAHIPKSPELLLTAGEALRAQAGAASRRRPYLTAGEARRHACVPA